MQFLLLNYYYETIHYIYIYTENSKKFLLRLFKFYSFIFALEFLHFIIGETCIINVDYTFK